MSQSSVVLLQRLESRVQTFKSPPPSCRMPIAACCNRVCGSIPVMQSLNSSPLPNLKRDICNRRVHAHCVVGTLCDRAPTLSPSSFAKGSIGYATSWDSSGSFSRLKGSRLTRAGPYGLTTRSRPYKRLHPGAFRRSFVRGIRRRNIRPKEGVSVTSCLCGTLNATSIAYYLIPGTDPFFVRIRARS